MILHLASASGNVFGYLWPEDQLPTLDGAAWARRLCARGMAFGLDGLFFLERPTGAPWRIRHWDADGAETFCSNGSRAALAIPAAPAAAELAVRSNDTEIRLRRHGRRVGIRMPEGPGFGLRPLPFAVDGPAGYGWVGNPQLVVEVPSVEAVDLPAFAPPLRHHPALEGGTNVNVVERTGEGTARIRSWERGVEGETLCCGTGCAVAAAWLAQQTGVSQWRFQPAGEDEVDVSVALQPDGAWRDLWVEGPVRYLGRVEVGEELLSPDRGTI